MSLTNTNREARRPERSVGLRDLRFAGTVAAGLVAGVLGVGALSAPLLGWTDWPAALQPGGGDETVQMKPGQRPPVAQNRTERTRSGRGGGESTVTIPRPGGSTLVIPAGDTTGTPISVSVPGDGSSGGGAVRVGRGGRSNGAGNGFGGSGFSQPNTADTDGDGMPDVWESRNGLNPLRADDFFDADGDGIPNGDE